MTIVFLTYLDVFINIAFIYLFFLYLNSLHVPLSLPSLLYAINLKARKLWACGL